MTTLILDHGSSSEARMYCYDSTGREIGSHLIRYGLEPERTKLPAGTVSVKLIPIIDLDI